MDSQWLHHLLSLYLYLAISIPKTILSALSHIRRFPFAVTLANATLSVYYRSCDLSPCTVDLDDQTTMHFWTPTHRRFNKPNLVLIHGYGSNSLWQFLLQVGPLSKSFNLYVPDLLFFGKSFTNRTDRTEAFQAKCVCEGLRGLGVEKCSVYAISYGGWVGYRTAEMYPEMVEKVVIVSSGVGATEEQKWKHLGKLGRDVREILCPETPENFRSLANLTIHKYNVGKWAPDFFLREFITVIFKNYKKERVELVEHLIAQKADSDLPILTQDRVFPVFLAHQLQRHLGPKSRVEIIKGTGHAANIESPDALNDLIKSFVLGSPKN
ncbi:hypothetical protein CEY00_Acc12809 [Actinidia chinensis var. chinensis]|uniref:AB hydrolase-1 domain-containing protein n=1 Tax=Actinidia chinensis var. chinensis TaxID=1590841 RepID=A0A2R6R0D8_ACTCC|nr:hypothetical protein CEY00_Acc12809 [Actinidia chinensis var. chinensis]